MREKARASCPTGDLAFLRSCSLCRASAIALRSAFVALWIFAGTLHTLAVHGGYGVGDEGFHDLHHERFTCNYGARRADHQQQEGVSLA